MTNNSKKTFLSWTLRIAVSGLFIISALAKLSKGHLLDSPYFAISTFEVKQLYPLGFSEIIAAHFSRTLIGIELALGLLLLQNNWLRKFIIPITTLLLAVFIGHLSYVTFLSGGNTGNCGCFGELLPMTPVQAIVKNIVAIGLLGYLYYLLPKKEKNGNFWILTSVLFATILGIYMIAPIQPQIEPNLESTKIVPQENIIPEVDSVEIAKPITNIDTLTKKKSLEIETKKVADQPAKHKSGYASYFSSIDKGKKVFCLFVPGCEHCRAAAKELTEMKQKNKNFPEINIVFMNEEADLIPDFFKFAGATYPYKIIEIIPFWKLLGTGRDTPGVKYLWNGNEYAFYYGITDKKFNAPEFEALVNKPFSDWKK